MACAALLAASAPSAAQGADFALLSDDQLKIFQRDLARGYFGNKLLRDPVVDLYLERTFAKVKSPARTAIFAVRNSQVNALAAWGNVLLIHTGLINFASSESELIGVLAHEAGHTIQEHFTRLPDKLEGPTALATAALVVGILSYSKNPELSDALIGSAVGGLQSQAYSQVRVFEREADSIALRLLDRAGISSAGFIRLLEGFGRTADTAPEYLRTHPISTNRIAAVQARARQLAKHPEPTPNPDLALIQERIRWLGHESNSAADRPVSYALARSDYAAVADRNEQSAAAARRLEQRMAGNWIAVHALGAYYSSTGQLKEADRLLAQALADDPGNRVLIAERLDVLAKMVNRGAASLLLGKIPPEASNHPLVAQAEARMWRALGQKHEFRIALARYNYLDGKPQRAREQVAEARALGAGTDQSEAKLAQTESEITQLEMAIKQIAGQ